MKNPDKKIDEKKFLEGIMMRAEAMSRGDYMMNDQAEGINEDGTSGSDYKYLFLRKSSIKSNSGKQVFIRLEYHTKITQMLFCLGLPINISSYIDNILSNHFGQYQNEIDKIIADSEFIKNLKQKK